MNSKISKRKLSKSDAGITLIALVITIIVLLILVGVSITAAVNGNGIFARARKAGNVWKNSEANEQAALDELSDTYDDLAYQYAGIEKPVKPLTDKEWNEINKQNQSVTTTTADDGVTLNWKLFYDDNGTKYLKADPVYWKPDEAKLTNGARKPKLLTSYDDTSWAIEQAIQADTDFSNGGGYDSSKVTYTPSGDSYNFFKAQNPVWNKERGNTEFSALDENEQCSVYLSDPDVWSAYKAGLETALGRKVKYVYGSPSADLYAKAYNAQEGIKDTEKITLQYDTKKTSHGYGYEYTQNDQTNYWTDEQSLKVNGNLLDTSNTFRGDKWWYLGSPSAAFSDSLCFVYSGYASLSYDDGGSYDGAVSLVAVVE